MSAVAPVPKMPVRMTVREFLDWADLTPGRWELVDGEPRAMTPPLRTHGAIAGELISLLGTHFRDSRSACSVIVDGGIVPEMLSAHNMRVPDFVVAGAPYATEERAISDPVLIVEILSPSNRAETWSNVWTYTTIPSVREILILHGDVIRAELLRRDARGAWPRQPEAIAEDGELVLESVAFRGPLAAAYRTTRLAPGAAG